MKEHQPVMVDQVLEYLACQPGQVIVDCTVGSGGHALALLSRIGTQGQLVGIDQDAEAIERSRERLAGYPVSLVHGNFADLDTILDSLKLRRVDGFLFDLGLASEQLEAAERGFSFLRPGPLDMRMNQDSPTTAAELVNRLPEKELERIIREHGQERWARRIARHIAASRQKSPINTTAQLAAIVAAAIPPGAQPAKIHAATRTFQALRIAVNDELGALERGLVAAIHRSSVCTRIAVLSYHSLEDGATKRIFRRFAGPACPPSLPLLEVLTRKPVRPTPQQVAQNPRARSARLRAAHRTQ